jgi:hypothetical protein
VIGRSTGESAGVCGGGSVLPVAEEVELVKKGDEASGSDRREGEGWALVEG